MVVSAVDNNSVVLNGYSAILCSAAICIGMQWIAWIPASIAKKAHKVLECRGVSRTDFKFYKNKFYIFNEKLDVIDGKIEVPNTPGLGVTIKEELIIRE